MPAADGPAPRPTDQELRVSRGGSVGDRRGPEEAGELARCSDDADVAGLAAGAHLAMGAVQAQPGAVADLYDVGALAGLACGERDADAWLAGVVQAASTSSRRASVEPVLVMCPCREDSPD